MIFTFDAIGPLESVVGPKWNDSLVIRCWQDPVPAYFSSRCLELPHEFPVPIYTL